MLTISGFGEMYNYSYSNKAPWNTYKDLIKRIIIENGIIKIPNYSFYYCTNLLSIDIPDSVIYINESAFDNCTSLKNINLPNSVTFISNNAFYRCIDLTNITLSNSITNTGS